MINGISIEKYNIDTKKYEEYISLIHTLKINKFKGSEFVSSGAEQSKQELIFTVRYNPKLRDIELNTQLYRILYDGVYYDINDYDDYMMLHQKITLKGESTNG